MYGDMIGSFVHLLLYIDQSLARSTHYHTVKRVLYAPWEMGPWLTHAHRILYSTCRPHKRELGHLLDVVDADENALSALVQDGQFLGELSLVDGGRSHGTGAMHLAASRLVRERRSTKNYHPEAA